MNRVRVHILIAAVSLILAIGLAYSNSLRGPFVFDDIESILTNPTIRHLWPVSVPLNPPGRGVTVQGRPLLNLTFAINYALFGFKVSGYHCTNVVIHLLATLLVFGIARRVTRNLGVSLLAASLWGLHPLQTESVTFVVQRAESLMGLFYLLTLYGFIRWTGSEAQPSAGWKYISVGACLFGMATKEVMVSAPIVVFLFDRSFVAGSFQRAWSERRCYYVCLAGTWVLLSVLVFHSGSRGATSGLGSGVPPTYYWLTQPPAILHYLGLMVWPTRLIFDYGTPWIVHPMPYLFDYLCFLGSSF